MNAIQESFTDKLFANYEANVKYQAIENAASHNGIFVSSGTSPKPCRQYTCFLIGFDQGQG